jgi:hypothetical protein
MSNPPMAQPAGTPVVRPSADPIASGPLSVRTLVDGGQAPEEVGAWLTAFVSEATATLDIAVYDFALSPAVMAPLAAALSAAAARGSPGAARA